MNRYMPIIFSAIFLLMAFVPCQVLAASITEDRAAIGKGCTASGYASTAMGYYTTANQYYSTAMGYGTTASGYYSTAMGYYTKASRSASTAMGHYTKASGYASTAMGNGTTAGGYASTAMGQSTTASGQDSTAMGYETTAGGDVSFAGGRYMQLSDTANYTFVWGNSDPPTTPIYTPNAFLIFPAGIAGKVGIGTPNPRHLLDLGSTIQSKKLAVYQGPDGNSFYGFGIASNTLQIYAGADEPDGPAMVVKKATGRVGIGTTDPGYLLEVNGSAAKPGGGSWSVSSDERLKDIKGAYEGGLNGILELRPVAFYYKEGNQRGLPSNEEYIGFVAQEVQDVFPEAVSEGPDGYLDFNMHPVNVAVVNAIKELKAENDTLKAENAMLKKDIEKIKTILGI